MSGGVIKAPVRLVGEDGNAFAIIGRTVRALEEAGNPPAVIERYRAEATSGDYNNLLRVTMDYTFEPEDD